MRLLRPLFNENNTEHKLYKSRSRYRSNVLNVNEISIKAQNKIYECRRLELDKDEDLLFGFLFFFRIFAFLDCFSFWCS